MKTFTQSLKTIVLALILALGVSYAFAWTAPTTAPTGGNTASPINTSVNNQSKSGTVTLTKTGAVQGLETYGKTLLATISGNVGIGTTTPPAYKLDVAGQIRSSLGGFVFPDGTTQITAGGGGGGYWNLSGSLLSPSDSSNIVVIEGAASTKVYVLTSGVNPITSTPSCACDINTTTSYDCGSSDVPTAVEPIGLVCYDLTSTNAYQYRVSRKGTVFIANGGLGIGSMPGTGQLLNYSTGGGIYGDLISGNTVTGTKVQVWNNICFSDGFGGFTKNCINKNTVLGGGGGGVSQIIAGSNVTISPSGGTGAVTINAAGGAGDGNNYTTGISFSGSGTKTLTLNRLGLTDLTASFTDSGTVTSIVRARLTAAQPISNITTTTLIVNNKYEDAGAEYNSATGVFTATAAGKYAVSGSVAFSTNATGFREIGIYVNDAVTGAVSRVDGSSSYITYQNVSDIVSLGAGSTIKLKMYQNSGGALSASDGAISIIQLR